MDKMIDCSEFSDEVVEMLRGVVKDMTENDRPYIVVPADVRKWNGYIDFDRGVFAMGLAGIIMGGGMWLWDAYQRNKLLKK